MSRQVLAAALTAIAFAAMYFSPNRPGLLLLAIAAVIALSAVIRVHLIEQALDEGAES